MPRERDNSLWKRFGRRRLSMPMRRRLVRLRAIMRRGPRLRTKLLAKLRKEDEAAQREMEAAEAKNKRLMGKPVAPEDLPTPPEAQAEADVPAPDQAPERSSEEPAADELPGIEGQPPQRAAEQAEPVQAADLPTLPEPEQPGRRRLADLPSLAGDDLEAHKQAMTGIGYSPAAIGHEGIDWTKRDARQTSLQQPGSTPALPPEQTGRFGQGQADAAALEPLLERIEQIVARHADRLAEQIEDLVKEHSGYGP